MRVAVSLIETGELGIWEQLLTAILACLSLYNIYSHSSLQPVAQGACTLDDMLLNQPADNHM